MWVQCGCFSWWCLAGFHRVHWWQAFRLQDLKGVGSGPLVVCPCLLSVISLCLWCITLEYGSISRFKGVFRGVYSVCVGLCCLGGLRGLWGFLCACGVRRLYDLWRVCLRFSSFAPVFASFCPLFFFALVVFACPLALSLLFLFPFRIYAQKERAQFLASSLRVLWACL